MAAPAVIQVDGAKQLRKQAKAAEVDLALLKDTHKDIANQIAGWSRPLAPTLTGRLVSTTRAAGSNTASTVRVGTKSVPYANPIHWGWKKRGIEANEWLLKAARDSEPLWWHTYTKAVEEILEKIKGRGTS